MKSKIPTNLLIVRQKKDRMHNKWTMASNQHRTGRVKLKKWKLVEEYCENSTVHGMRYFSKRDIHFFERTWWIVVVSCSLVACCVAISQSYTKWDQNPVIVTFSEKMTALKEIPFPAVTICPETKTHKSIFNYRETLIKVDIDAPPLYNLTPREIVLLSAQFQICDPNIIYNEKNVGDNFTTDVIFDLIREVAPTLKQSLVGCTFRTFPDRCEDIFQEIVTDDGLCFTFNSLYPKAMFMENVDDNSMSSIVDMSDRLRWTLEDGYTNGYDDNSTSNVFLYPYRVLNAGSKAGLKVVMALRVDDMEYACRGPVQGFKVMLHPPNELPQVDGHFFRVPLGTDVRVSIKPNVMRTTPSLSGYNPNRRRCFFNFERKLRYMRAYSQRNCELECLSNYTFESCGCVKFTMPHDNTTPICGLAKVNCYNAAENELLEDTETIQESKKINGCNCLPACSAISYDSEISQASYEWRNYFRARNYTNHSDIQGLQFGFISIYFKESQFITSKRSELIGFTDFVASCGGLLGLFMGVSILSIVELIYYSSLRLFCSMRSDTIDEQRQTLPKLKPRVPNQRDLPFRPWYIGRT